MTYSKLEELYNSYQRMEYKDNPELAKEIHNAINTVKSLGSTKNGAEYAEYMFNNY